MRKPRLPRNKITCLKISVGNTYISQVPQVADMSLSSNQSCHYHSVTSGVASKFSETGTLTTGREKHGALPAIPAVRHAASHLIGVNDISRRAGPTFTTLFAQCAYTMNCRHLRKEAHTVGPGLDKITGSAQSGHKADRPDRKLYSVVLLFSTEGTVKQRGGILLLFLTCYTVSP